MVASLAHALGPDAAPSLPSDVMACFREQIYLDNMYLDAKISEWIRPEYTCGWS
jgi:hypothetical protein